MTAAGMETTLVLLAVGLLLASQCALWWRAGRAAPQATWMAALTQASALGVLALYLDEAGLRRPAVVVGTLAGTAVLGLASASRATGRAARASGHDWLTEHRRGLRSTIVAVEALVAVLALAMTVSWAADRFNSDFNGKADDSLCRLLDGRC